MSEKKVQESIPWQKKQEWAQVLESIQRVDHPGDPSFKDLRSMAKKVQGHFEQISGCMDQVCLNTCPDCTDICCVRATIWFDFKDLLYLYFGRGHFPGKQMIKNQTGPAKGCSCLGADGCTLSRLERPFVCTWYLCPQQKKALAAGSREKQKTIDGHLTKIKQLRQKMEDAFVQAASGKLFPG